MGPVDERTTARADGAADVLELEAIRVRRLEFHGNAVADDHRRAGVPRIRREDGAPRADRLEAAMVGREPAGELRDHPGAEPQESSEPDVHAGRADRCDAVDLLRFLAGEDA